MTLPVADALSGWDMGNNIALIPKIGLNYMNPNSLYLPLNPGTTSAMGYYALPD